MAEISTMPTVSPAMDLKQAAIYLNSSVKWVRQQVYAGRLSYQRIGKKHCVPRREVENLLESGWRRNGK
jgi:excisionase family DNA binding protein